MLLLLDAELESLFDARVKCFGKQLDKIQIEDQSGRRLKVTQGAGDGTLFGTDAVNNGGLLANETVRNNLNFAAWDGDNLVVTNTAGGKLLDGFMRKATVKFCFNTVIDSQSEGVNEPILLASALQTRCNHGYCYFYWKCWSSHQVSIRFSDRLVNGSSAQYSFQITDGEGDVYGSVENTLSFYKVEIMLQSNHPS